MSVPTLISSYVKELVGTGLIIEQVACYGAAIEVYIVACSDESERGRLIMEALAALMAERPILESADHEDPQWQLARCDTLADGWPGVAGMGETAAVAYIVASLANANGHVSDIAQHNIRSWLDGRRARREADA